MHITAEIQQDRERLFANLIQLDIEGNTKAILDPRGNAVMQYSYNMLGHRLYQNSREAGPRWTLANVIGNPRYSWDNRVQLFITDYDILHRPQNIFLVDASGNKSLIEKAEYGESLVDGEVHNLRGQVHRQYDSSGLITNEQFDFKSNLLQVSRQLAAAYEEEIVDWSPGSPTSRLEEERFTQITEYDALNRMSRLYNWHRTPERVAVYEPSYSDRGLLVLETHTTAARKTPEGHSGGIRLTAVEAIQYDEKGQRQQIHYGNGSSTKYHYDPSTYRLRQLRTTRHQPGEALPRPPDHLSDASVLQNLYYTYDAVGNIVQIEDDAHEVVFENNQRVEAISRYSYDALSRLIEASGRENNSFDNAPRAETPQARIPFPVGGRRLRNYRQHYSYDPGGNILSIRHIADEATERWTRTYAYAVDSNRLLSTQTGTGVIEQVAYGYNDHGSMLNYNNSSEEYRAVWDYKERVHRLHLGGGGNAFYQYDSGLERSRKVVEYQGGIKEERLYLGGMEVYRRWRGGALEEEIETHHLFVDDQRVLIIEEVLQTNNPQLVTGILYRYQYGNHLGSVGLEVNGLGNIISYEEYHPYGTLAYQAKNQAILATAKRYRYTGMERDEESGLNYHSARYYLPWLGRWLSTDPIGVKGGVNVYKYANNNPLKFIDKGGTQTEYIDIADDHILRELFDELADLEISPPTGRSDVPISAGTPLTRRQARRVASADAYRARPYLDITQDAGGEIQAGHSRAARHAAESRISREALTELESLMPLHSRRVASGPDQALGRPNLRVTVTDQHGRVRQRTRHRAQEPLINEGVDRVRRTQGTLTAEGQIAAGEEVLWRTQGTGFDQREVELRRASGAVAPLATDADVDSQGRVVDGPKTRAVMSRRASGATASRARVLERLRAIRGRIGRGLSAAGGAASSFLGAIGIVSDVEQIITDLQEWDRPSRVNEESIHYPIPGIIINRVRVENEEGEIEYLTPEEFQSQLDA